MAPTKELAAQTYDVLKSLLAFHLPSATALKIASSPETDGEEEQDSIPPGPYLIPQLLVGGRTKLSEDLIAFTTLNPNVLVGTPKRLTEILASNKVTLKRHWFDLLVLDEADRLLDPNFYSDLQTILQLVPKERRTGLFSASVSEAVNELVRVGMRYPFKISAKVRSKSGELDKRTPESLKLYYLTTKPTMKIPSLKRILQQTETEKVIVYVSSRAGVDYWNHVLPAILGMHVFPLHGDHKSAIRTKNLQRFRDCAKPAMLLTTDVLARGIDIPDIDIVVQLDPPTQPKDFIHRCGRSGRAGRPGMAITFLNEGNQEEYINYLDIQVTKVVTYPSPPVIPIEEAIETTASIRKVLMMKRELHDRSQKAFVSWVQAFRKTLPPDIFNINKLDWIELGKAWGLLRWPKMPELKRYLPQTIEDRRYGLDILEDFKLEGLAYTDKVQESKRQAMLEMIASGGRPVPSSRLGGAMAELNRRKERAWSGQKDAKAVREGRREKKVVKRQAERKAKMSETEKNQERELDQLIAKVRARNAAEEESFEGFDD